MKAAEADAIRVVMEKSPVVMQSQMASLIDEYDVQVTPESRFVKAIDKLNRWCSVTTLLVKQFFIVTKLLKQILVP